jgi:hypothetical protein
MMRSFRSVRFQETGQMGISQRKTHYESQMPFAKRQRPHASAWLHFCSVHDFVEAAFLDVPICSTQRN